MKTVAIRTVHAREILDSRGRPTVEVDAILDDGSFGRASVPSGASTGAAEAHELRDGDPARYAGLGVQKAVANVNGEIAGALRGTGSADQRRLDDRLRELDGTPRLQRLGANAALGVSLAVCRAAAASRGQALYERIADLAQVRPTLPLPMTNILSGGLHAGRGMDVQDFLAVPMRAASIDAAIHLLARVRSAATELSRERGLPILLADEGGLSPGCETGRGALELMVQAIERAGLIPGEDIAIAIDVAATALKEADGRYRLAREGRDLSGEAMIGMIEAWVADFPVVSVEDGLDEEDWIGWKLLTARLGSKVQLVGDDLFTTSPRRLARGIDEGIGNAVLVKANQNGTLTGTLDVIAQAKVAGYATIVSARSGETEDAFMSDLAVGTAAGQIKIGSLRTSSTVAKYNQLLRIEEQSGASFAGIAALAPRRAR
ncbi:MAG: phosphopyruvate hydratase [Betaproteobacteria bacterium]|nr:MAG: phosphopyruvate hydratase [Betaproteobacteria bacterium]